MNNHQKSELLHLAYALLLDKVYDVLCQPDNMQYYNNYRTIRSVVLDLTYEAARVETVDGRSRAMVRASTALSNIDKLLVQYQEMTPEERAWVQDQYYWFTGAAIYSYNVTEYIRTGEKYNL